MQAQGFHHLAIQVLDVERTATFYSEVLGLTELARHRRPDGSLRSVWVGLPDSGFIALEHVEARERRDPRPHEAPGILLVALRIRREDRGAALAELARRGVSIEHQTRWTIYFRDPEGNRIALSHHPLDPLS
jgi:glyoxylase I family protein